jgi:hypothetical protein
MRGEPLHQQVEDEGVVVDDENFDVFERGHDLPPTVTDA